MEDLYCEIVTPDKVIYGETVGLVTVPGEKGQFTLLKNHAPIISVLKEGKIRVISKTGREEYYDCKSGVLECENNKVTILIHKGA
ncbi:ATP synthase F1 subunit epsilon [Carboxylicivirga sp. A043]|uniref:ATP synthase F1 subunit epsilon n=1 Tax=Carboxylicivirga litoralis TaxID=2816963 RepID=UPI0021CB990D|nr:ATP synthase F1 subunit epsilon [Carboxylicivirga sp. A043]MCU4155162.1 ATP synthase F1 subunit epsilon [Carboxylicivirga sp. A043]